MTFAMMPFGPSVQGRWATLCPDYICSDRLPLVLQLMQCQVVVRSLLTQRSLAFSTLLSVMMGWNDCGFHMYRDRLRLANIRLYWFLCPTDARYWKRPSMGGSEEEPCSISIHSRSSKSSIICLLCMLTLVAHLETLLFPSPRDALHSLRLCTTCLSTIRS